MGIKERRTKILLALFLISDVNFSPVNFDERIQKIFDLTLNEKTRGTVSGLIKEEMIEKLRTSQESEAVNQNISDSQPVNQVNQLNRLTGLPVNYRRSTDKPVNFSQSTDSHQYSLTAKGFYELCLQFPFFRFIKDVWDGKWRIISYEIPEKKRKLRDRLRREMKGWGLGPWHRSFWLTPHPVIDTLKSLVSQKEEEEYIQAFEAEYVFGDREVLIEKVWGRSGLEKSYRQLFKNWHAILSGQADKVDKLKKVVGEYINLLKIDPGLPKELLGEKWIGFEGWSIFKEIRAILLS